ncbi:4Fe-4S binding protein [Helicobacter sp. 13S00477-4]|uniref:4Fe-4S binding protein n=1 Tax=Helicobacter sp. 13S00477-4 TaxID=1905759 RepID=UPI000BC68035|nr:4Fe-4S binding protein [Helicobacter sp. 13S00477-4]PAF52203.1 hypothetical protein BKH44_03630 [Helicobacter sp. 13S00477-4]
MNSCEFLFVNDPNFKLQIQGQEDWLMISDSPNFHATISNHPFNCDIYAPEINWYLKNSQASIQIKIQNIKRMYFSRMSRYDYGTERDFMTHVNPTLLIIGEGNEAESFLTFMQDYKEFHYEIGLISPDKILSISGSLGAFEARVKIDEGVGKIIFAQAVIFYEDENLIRFMGVEKASDYEDEYTLLEKLNSRVGTYHYKTTITYQTQNCQYFHRRPNKDGQGYCHKCANVCPTFGITKDDSSMELSFSQLDCIGCGACVAVCPSGSLDYAPFNMQAFNEALKYYQNTQILLIAQPFLNQLENFKIPPHISPLIINREKFLSENHILALLQESGSSCVYFSEIISQPSNEAIKLINDIYQKIYQKTGFYIAKTPSELNEFISNIEQIQPYHYSISPNEYKRQHFAERLRFAIKNNDYGNVKSGESAELIRYGKIHIQEDKCTLCMSCVGACNVGSLQGNASKFSLQFNPSLCTTCGYCIDSCPENALSLELSGIDLNPNWFENKTIAQDETFNCIECKKAFATKKSIEKIKSIMIPIFAEDKLKIKTLECCPECKIKIMFKKNLQEVI